MFDVGVPELVMILVVALIVFGPGKLPEVGASLGKAMRDFRNATQGISDEIQSVTRLAGPLESEADMRARLLREQQTKVAALPTQPQAGPIASVPVVAASGTMEERPEPYANESTTQTTAVPGVPTASPAAAVEAVETPTPSSL